MSTPLTELVRDALRTVKYPGFSRDIVSFGIVKNITDNSGDIHILLKIATANPDIPDALRNNVEEALRTVPGILAARLEITVEDAPAAADKNTAPAIQTRIPGIRHVIAVASGKGGVGKSTVASNLAIALLRTGATVGLCDCDLYGPSIPLMLGSRERPGATENNTIIPIEQHGLKLMSMGFLLEDNSPVILRGPMVTRYTQQFLRQVEWGELDFLILDLPPGTGDIQLTIVQTVALAGAVIVTTPQEVALIDARKAAAMFAKVNVPLIGIVENMSYFLCPDNGKRYDIFGNGGGQREARRLKVPLLAQIPLDIPTREAGDRGCPVTIEEPAGLPAQEFQKIAQAVRAHVGQPA